MSRASMTIGEFEITGKKAQAWRRSRKRSWKKIIWWSSACVLVVGGLLVFGYWLLTSPMFTVKRVESGSFRFTAKEDVDQALTECLGANIWTLSTSEITEHLSVLPWVRDLRVDRRLPDTIGVDFREWRPLLAVAAQTAAGSVSDEYVLLENGRVLPFPSHLTMPGLPILVGIDLESTETAGIWRIPVVTTARVLDLVAAIEQTGLEANRPVDFLVAGTNGFTVVLQGDGGRLLVGHEDFAARLNRYLIAADRVPNGADVDLRFQDRLSFPAVAGSRNHQVNTTSTHRERP